MLPVIYRLIFVIFFTTFFISGCTSEGPFITLQRSESNSVVYWASSQHFDYFCTSGDTEVIDTLSKELEAGFERVSPVYNISVNDPIDVKIYPDFETFHANVEWPTADIPATLVGQCLNGDEIKIISPLNSEPINSYGEILQVAVHESMHAYHFRIYESAARSPYPPPWLFEGFASFEADLGPSLLIIRQIILSGDLPRIQDYEDYDFFNENYGYHFSYTIFEFLLNEYGHEKVSILLRYPFAIEYSLGPGITMEVLNEGWHAFLIDNYS